MTILDYIAANPGCSGGEIAAALNTQPQPLMRSYADSGAAVQS